MSMVAPNTPFVGEDPFQKDRDLIYAHIGTTKKITWNFQFFLAGSLLLLLFLRFFKKRVLPSSWLSSLWWQAQPRVRLLRHLFMTNSTMVTIGVFYCINSFVFLYKLPLHDAFNFALRSGLVASSNLPLLYIIPLKSGPLLHLTGLSYETVLIYHKFVGALVIGIALIHGLGFFRILTWEYCLANQHMLSGYVLITLFILVALSSLQVVRRRFYELFYYAHIVSFTLFLPVFFFHHYLCKTYVVLICGMLLYDRLVRYVSYMWYLSCEVSSADGYLVVSVEPNYRFLSRSQKWISLLLLKAGKKFHWQPSNHLFLTIPKINRFQSHPFTIASLPADHKCTLLIKIHDGFTRRLQKQVEMGITTFSCFVHGPYGTSHHHLPSDLKALERDEMTELVIAGKVQMYSTSITEPSSPSSSFSSTASTEKIILVAGGIGLSLILPLFKMYDGSYDLSFVWITRSEALLSLIDLDTSSRGRSTTVTVWNTDKRGRPNLRKLLYSEHDIIHIVGCGPSSLMSSVREVALEFPARVNLILEEFSF